MFSSVLLETGFCYIPLADLELRVQSSLVLNLQSACLSLPNAGIPGMHPHAQEVALIVKYPTQSHVFEHFVSSWWLCFGRGGCGIFYAMDLAGGFKAIIWAELEGCWCLVT